MKTNEEILAQMEEDIRQYLAYLITEKKLVVSTVNTYNAALRFLFGVTRNRNPNYRQIPRLRQARSLLDILNRDEMTRISENTSTWRNKAMQMTAYGAGLRVSELCSLRIRDIHSDSMRIFVNHGKGGKNRYTILSQTNLEVLREYCKACRSNHLEGWLFLNKDGSERISDRTIQGTVNTTVKRAVIKKDVTIHTLRNCFATYLLEDGVDVCRIKQLLGHTRIQSTAFYLHLLNFDGSLKSPLDSMPKKHGRQTKTAGVADA